MDAESPSAAINSRRFKLAWRMGNEYPVRVGSLRGRKPPLETGTSASVSGIRYLLHVKMRCQSVSVNPVPGHAKMLTRSAHRGQAETTPTHTFFREGRFALGRNKSRFSYSHTFQITAPHSCLRLAGILNVLVVPNRTRATRFCIRAAHRGTKLGMGQPAEPLRLGLRAPKLSP